MDTDEQPWSASPARGRTFSFHECIGRGGFGEVYRATMTLPSGVQQTVAAKILRKELDPYGQSVQRLRDEAHLLSALDHPVLLKVWDLVLLDGRIGLVTEFVDGIDLLTLLRDPDVSTRMLGESIADVASGLEAAWTTPGPDGRPMQLVHRDIKPANMRLSRHGQLKLLDFGIARANMERQASTTTDTIIGTYQYMAPERFGHVTGPGGDIYALGCVLFEALARRRYLYGLSLQKHFVTLASRSNYQDALDAEIATLPADVPERASTLLRQMLAFEADNRPGAGEVSTRLERLAPGLRGLPTRAWCRSYRFPSLDQRGDLTGVVLVENELPSLDRPAPAPPAAADSTSRQPRRGTQPLRRVTNPPSVETVDLVGTMSAGVARSRRARRQTTPLWMWLALLGALLVVGALTLSLFAGVIASQALFPDEETASP